MRVRRRVFLLGAAGAAVVLAAAGYSEARMHAPYRGHRIIPAGVAPLDGFAQPTGAYSFRKLRGAYAGPAIRIRRASDNLETDINFLGCTGFTGCPWDAAAATAHCAATSCFGVTWYDQSGAVRSLGPQVTAANQPALVFNCNGALPCLQYTLTNQSLASAAFTPTTGVMSKSVVANRTAGTNFVTFFRSGGATGNRVNGNSVATQWIVNGASGSIVPTASNAAWHAAQIVINGASSVVSIDGTETTGTITGGVTAAPLTVIGSTGSTFNEGEVVFWDGYALTAGERAALTANQRAYGWIP